MDMKKNSTQQARSEGRTGCSGKGAPSPDFPPWPRTLSCAKGTVAVSSPRHFLLLHPGARAPATLLQPGLAECSVLGKWLPARGRGVCGEGGPRPRTVRWVTAAAPHRSLSAAFSRFGLLYAVRVFANAAAAPQGSYAMVKFYSARAAHSAQGACGRQPLFQSSPLKIRLSRHKAVQHRALALNSSQCQELASYYFGFNGWSERIVRLQDLSDLEERENEDIVAPLQKQSIKIFCALEVVLSPFDCKSPGVGIAKEILDKLEESGKIPVEYRPFEELTDARTT
ncbi:RAD52 motif-containing protein 1-like [Sorex araneus]|uniref:RAD52 motif-containing protein 1-like n=1 Tax=Sorex araneus TaxID=42254 RepID=UPI00243339B0|nr:RAD52 motif-containing protein 1-like [Sorex araneus]